MDRGAARDGRAVGNGTLARPLTRERLGLSRFCFVFYTVCAMRRILLLSAVLFVPVTTSAQTFPAPGTGAYTWERVGDRPTSTEGFAFSPDGHLFADIDSDFPFFVFLPAPSGPPAGTWRVVFNQGRLQAGRYVFPLSADTLLYGHSSAIFRTTDGGATVTLVHGTPFTGNGGPDTPDAMLELPRGHAHAGRIVSSRYALYSDDRGATWTEGTIPPGTESSDHFYAAMPSGRILVATTRGVAASDDGGESYGHPVFGLSGTPDALAAFATPGSVQSGAPDCGLADASLCDGAVLFGSSGLAPQGGAMLRTNDGGRTWSPLTFLSQPNDGIGSSTWAGVVSLGPGPGGLGRGVAVGARGVAYTTADGGVTWSAVGRMPFGEDVIIEAQMATLLRLGPDGHLWVAAPTNSPYDRGWLYRSAEPATAAFAVTGEAPPDAPEDGVDVYPNPTGDRASVRVSVAEPASAATVSVYDALGRRVAVLHDGPLAAGAHGLAFEAGTLPAGVYVVHVRVTPEGGGTWTEVRRVTVAR